jgi:hypothetical protein
MQLLDDRSYALRTLKDSLILRKKNSDTQLIVPDKVTITSWSDSVLAVRMLMERLHNLHKLIDQECGTLRRSSRNPNRDISNFLKTTNLSEYYSVLGFVDHFLLESIAMSEQLDEDIKKLFPLNAYETGQYQKEQSMGLYLYDISRVHFKNVYNAGRARSLQKKKQMSQIMSMLKTLAKDFEKFRTGNLKRRRRS